VTTTIEALYFPWIAIQGLETLKRALVYFDKVYVLSPPYQHTGLLIREAQGLPEKFHSAVLEFDEFRRQTATLREEGVLEFVDPYAFGVPSFPSSTNPPQSYAYTHSSTPDIEAHLAKIRRKVPDLEENSRLLSRSILADLSDEAFCRLPTPLEVFFQNDLILDYSTAGWTFSEFHGYDFHDMGPVFRSDIRQLEGFTLQDSLFTGDGERLMSYLGQSLIINRTIIAANALDAVPFTDETGQFKFLRNKFDRTTLGDEESKFLDALAPSLDFKAHGLGQRIIETNVPNLAGFSWEDILEIRAHAQEELAHFRIEVAKLATDIQSAYGSDTFEREADIILAKTVNPAVHELELKLKMSRLEILQQSFKKAQALKPVIPFAVSFFFNAPLILALMVAAGVVAADVALEAYLNKRKLKSSTGLSYLLNFK
jgi:hypothetical protein